MSICASSCLKSTFSQRLVHSLGVMTCCSDYSSNYNYDFFDYLGYFSIPDLHSDSDYGICYDMHCPHTALAVVDSAD